MNCENQKERKNRKKSEKRKRKEKLFSSHSCEVTKEFPTALEEGITKKFSCKKNENKISQHLKSAIYKTQPIQ